MSDSALPAAAPRNNLRVVLICLGVVAGMIGMSYAAVPLYSLFCQVTGYGGTTQVSEGNARGIISREMTTRFDATISSNLNWKVVPAMNAHARIGTVETVVYTATNLSDKPVTATASFNVTPDLAGLYFNKIECFCFTEQTLQPGETVEMPVTFFVDPELADVAELDTLREITLSYTFYASESGRS